MYRGLIFIHYGAPGPVGPQGFGIPYWIKLLEVTAFLCSAVFPGAGAYRAGTTDVDKNRARTLAYGAEYWFIWHHLLGPARA